MTTHFIMELHRILKGETGERFIIYQYIILTGKITSKEMVLNTNNGSVSDGRK